MAKCHDNRRKRRKRDKKHLERLAHQRFDKPACQAAGVNPDYFMVHMRVRTVMKNGRRCFDLRKMHVRVKPNALYHDLMATLLRLTEGVTVTIPRLSTKEDPELAEMFNHLWGMVADSVATEEATESNT